MSFPKLLASLRMHCCLAVFIAIFLSSCATFHGGTNEQTIDTSATDENFWNAGFWSWLPQLAPGEYGSWTP